MKVVRINGKPFDFDSTESYAGERPDRGDWMLTIITLAVLSLLAFGIYPLIVSALKWLFGGILGVLV